ncbi:MAG: NAD-dependent epimerase/dehydratase family protein [Candidatus Heimdallarchaeota archaeon]|nr:NAD-dependent epimerase/dehydratase family protein [Candidatus Heimdallarchaeota archaeon]
MKKILVVGGEGYIGSKLVIYLANKGYTVENFDLPKNILNEEELREAVNGMDIVYHLAALAVLDYTDKNPQETFEVNIVGANNVARICAEEGAILNFVSTSCIYGNPLEVPSVEDRLINPTDTYAASKASGEYLVKMWGMAKQLKYNILRFGTVYGQSVNREMRGDMACQIFMEAAVNKEPIKITGDGNQSRYFIHIDDLVNALVILAGEDVIGETINLTGNESISINDIADYALEFGATGKSYVAERKDDFVYQNVSISKAKDLLGWEPHIRFSDGIKDFYNWLKK